MIKNKRCISSACRLILVVFLALIFGCYSKQKKNHNVVFISLDTTRYDHVDTGRGARASTPELRNFSQDSVVFENAFSTSPLTLPSHLSVFTSCYAHEFGVLRNNHIYEGCHKMIQQVFGERGYHTAAIISLGTLGRESGLEKGFQEFRDDFFEEGVFFVPAEKVTREAVNTIENVKNRKFFLFVHYSDPHTPYAPPDLNGPFQIYLDGELAVEFNAYTGAILKKDFPLAKGSHVLDFKVVPSFEHFSHFIIRRLRCGPGSYMATENLEFSRELYGGSYIMSKPQSRVMVNSGEDSFIKIFQIIPILNRKAALEYYRKEVEYMDRHAGKFFHALEENGLLPDTVVAVFGDHGEGHGEREGFFGHSRFLNRQFIHVPLIIRFPGMEGKRLFSPVSLLSLSPTVLDFLGIRDKSFKRSKSVLKEIKKGKLKERPVYSFAFNPAQKTNKLSIIKWPYQAIFYLDQDRLKRQELYDLASCLSFSEADQIGQERIREKARKDYALIQKNFSRLKKIFSILADQRGKPSEEFLEKIKSLGYVNE